jgi:hypothetical protein
MSIYPTPSESKQKARFVIIINILCACSQTREYSRDLVDKHNIGIESGTDKEGDVLLLTRDVDTGKNVETTHLDCEMVIGICANPRIDDIVVGAVDTVHTILPGIDKERVQVILKQVAAHGRLVFIRGHLRRYVLGETGTVDQKGLLCRCVLGETGTIDQRNLYGG